MAKMKLAPVATFAAMLCWSLTAHAHSARATLDPTGTKPSFTAMAQVTCFNDGSGPPVALYVRVRDNSPAVAGLLINVQVLKGNEALSISDTVSGDADYSQPIQLEAGGGVYTVLINKTAAGVRNFDFEWHCVTTGHDHDHVGDIPHTGTEIGVLQFK